MRINCDCGKLLNINDTLVGKRIKCPSCGSVQLVQTPSAAADAIQGESSKPLLQKKTSVADDGEPDLPRSKKPIRKKRKNVSWLLIGGVAALLGLAVVSVVGWSRFVAFMKSHETTVASSVVWQETLSKKGRFKVQMPGTPFQESTAVQPGAAGMVIHKYTVFLDNKRELFLVLYMDFPEAALQKGSDWVLDVLANGVAADAKGTLQERKKIESAGIKGEEIKVKVPNTGYVTTRVFVSGNRGYQISVGMPEAKSGSPETLRFLDSFEIIKGD